MTSFAPVCSASHKHARTHAQPTQTPNLPKPLQYTRNIDLLAEWLDESKRGSHLLYIEYFWAAGSLYPALLAWVLLDTLGWRWLAVGCSLPPLAALASYRYAGM